MTRTPQTGDLLSDVDGQIAHVFHALPAEEPEAVPRILECHAGIARALGKHVTRTMLLHPEHEELLQRHETLRAARRVVWTKPRTLHLRVRGAVTGGTLRTTARPTWNDYTPWVQDICLVCVDGDGSMLLASPEIRRPRGSRDTEVTPLLGERLHWPCVMLPTGLEASNVLVDRRFVVVGSDVLRDRPRTTVRALLGALRGHRRIVTLPRRTAQPLPHQDLYLTLAGETDAGALAFVGSLRLAAQIRGERTVDEARERALDGIARELEQRGYMVDRLPLAPHTPDSKNRAWNSYNNVLVEVTRTGNDTVRRVVLPAYGTDGGAAVRDLDLAAAAIWAQHGFTVTWAEGPFDWLSVHEGSLRCLTKVLERR